MKRQARYFLLTGAVIFSLLAIKARADARFQPGVTYYFDTFNSAQKPWNPGFDLNEVRADVVERARQKLAYGELGRDTLKLADRIIDSLLSH